MKLRLAAPIGLALAALPILAHASEAVSAEQIVDVEKYGRAIHIMVMLLAGFGFLMVFVKRYGRSALTATYLLVSLALPLYFLKDKLALMGGSGSDIDGLILAEFAAASLLICAGAVLGRIKMGQYLVLGLLFIPCYALNEWILQGGGLGLIPAGAFLDTGGSILIHAFGALFGLAAIFSLTTRREYETEIPADATSDRFSMAGSMLLWIFWPSFCAALVPTGDVPSTAVNVILALCGSTLATYFASVGLRRKIAIADIANAALAGGVAIGSACARTGPGASFLIGILAGALSTFGFAVIQPRLQAAFKKVDTCGVLYLHGLPGLLGGIAVLFAVDGLDAGVQFTGIAVMVVIALAGGFVVGKIVSALGRREYAYEDGEEFLVEPSEVPGKGKKAAA
ncbi:MAG: ammonium transporter [Candidatus Zixiibacteriota bacterium]|nr:MAG: ammonium transporter [candidate division Zixibacteria bacterium]